MDVDGNKAELETRTWGLDIANSTSQTGGVGALLARKKAGAGEVFEFFYDGNGNVVDLLDASDAVVAHYEYDPFGGLTTQLGSEAVANDWRFSTKPQDSVTGLLYYGFRWYNPITGRWPSRDPVEEGGGVNLYGFVGNDGIMFVDLLGLAGDSNTSLSIDKNWRIDIEDHSAKDRNLHIQDKATKTKYFHDPNDGKFKTNSGSLLPKDIQKIIKNNRKYQNKIKNNIKKIKSLGGFAGVFVKKSATVITIGFAVKNVSEAHAAGAGYLDASKYGAAGVVSVSESMHEELGGKIVIITYQTCRVCKPGVGWLDRRINDMFEAMRLQDGGWKIKGCRTEQEKVFIK